MTLYNFWLSATALTDEERRHAQLPAHLQNDTTREKLGTDEYDLRMAQMIQLALDREREREREEAEPERHRWERPSRTYRFKS